MRKTKISSAFAMLLLSAMSVHAAQIDLSTFTTDGESFVAQNGDVLTDTLKVNAKISIADGAKVTLNGVTINGVNENPIHGRASLARAIARLFLLRAAKMLWRVFIRIIPVFIYREKRLSRLAVRAVFLLRVEEREPVSELVLVVAAEVS